MAKVKIGLDAGHGLKTSGKQTPDGIKEWTLNDKVRDKVVEILADYDCEIIHTDNNEGKVDEKLSDRVARYKKAGVDVFVSIHHNAHTGKWNSATGVEVYVDKNPTGKDLDLATCIYSRLVKYTGMKGRGIKEYNFWVINQDTIPAILVEGGFMDGRKDYKYITSDEGQTAYAKAVAEGLIVFCKLNKKPTKKPTTKKPTPKPVETSSKYFKKYTGKSTSLVDALKSIGATSSYSYRKKIAKANGVKAYVGTPKQNVKLLELLKKGKLIKP
jgi:N-acetylmuramoyl-L-alanine amidase